MPRRSATVATSTCRRPRTLRCDDDPPLGDHRAVARGGGLHEVAARSRRPARPRPRSPAPAPGTCCTTTCWWARPAARHPPAPRHGCARRRRSRTTPGGRADRRGCASGPCRVRGRRRSARRRGRRDGRRRSGTGTYSPKGTRCTFSKTPTTCPRGPQATIWLRKVVADAGSVTPTTSVEPSSAARRPSSAASGEPASGRSRATTSSGHSTSAGDGRTERDLVGCRELGLVHGGGRDLLLAQPTLPASLDQRHPQRPDGGRHRRAPRCRPRPGRRSRRR